MKNKFVIIPIVAVSALCLALSAEAINQPPLKGAQSSNNDSKRPPKKEAVPAKAAGKLSEKDKAFMMNAAKGGMMEVEWGKLAAQNGQNADVKKFGNRMVTDHSKANNELMALAKEEGVALPATKSGGKWKSDKDYMDMMVKDHEKDLAEFQAEASGGTDPDLKKFADKTSKMVQKHLAMAKEIQGKLK
jgi:putative membrane protein